MDYTTNHIRYSNISQINKRIFLTVHDHDGIHEADIIYIRFKKLDCKETKIKVS